MDLITLLVTAALVYAGGKLVQQLPKNQEIVVVLGISEKSHAYARVEAAIWTGKKIGAKLYITTGKGSGIDGQSEAEWMGAVMASNGCKVIMENKANSTASNVVNVSKILKKGTRVVVVSDHYHVKSAAWCFTHRYGIPARYVEWPTPKIQPVPTFELNDCQRAGCC
jgi:uncharacterized SAM-binding protein YcdF (DUF218 family)